MSEIAGTVKMTRGRCSKASLIMAAATMVFPNPVGACPILTVMALRDGVIPPTLNLRNLDPEIDLDVVAGEPRVGDYRYAVNNSFGFGGHNVALAFGKY